MNRSISRVGLVVSLLMLVLIGQLTYLQVIHADDLANDPRNVRTVVRNFNRPRGEIVTADGAIVARSVPSEGEFKFQREYPLGPLFAHVGGYQSFVVSNSGVEQSYDRVLSGRDTGINFRDLGDLVSNKTVTPRVVLALTRAAQQAAADALGNQRGSVVAVDVKTGAVVTMYSNPSYDPNPLAGHDSPTVQAAFDALTTNADNPALARSYRERYAPGSTFKVLTAGAALQSGIATTDRTFEVRTDMALPLTQQRLSNFGGQLCGGTLLESFVRSCNTTFGQLGLELGDNFVPFLENCGINSAPPIDLAPGAAVSSGPTAGSFQQNQPLFAYAGIGQAQVAVTPLEMALVTAAVGNGGVMMQPHVAARVERDDGRVLQDIEPQRWKTCMSPQTAQTLTTMMTQVVERGTGTAARIPGIGVAGKSGTAQTDRGAPHAWFVAFAPAEAPRFAVAVIVENGGSLGNEATGGAVAAPVASAVLRTLLGA